jgi:hypothetical protein
MAVSTLPKEETYFTNCDVDESPLGDTRSERDRVREPAAYYHVKRDRFARILTLREVEPSCSCAYIPTS